VTIGRAGVSKTLKIGPLVVMIFMEQCFVMYGLILEKEKLIYKIFAT
jgi:hypothetical protein